MQVVRVRLNSVFGIKRSAGYGGKPAHTTFGFSSSTLKKFAVEIPGHPQIEPGHTLLILLSAPDVWTNVLGWVNCTTGEIAIQKPYGPGLAAFLSVSISAFMLVKLPVIESLPTAVLWSAFTCAGLYWTFATAHSVLVSRALRQLRSLAHRNGRLHQE